eukprot:scaffold22599_cov139-Cylindrotheca_fusiformis.AAC.36
MLQYMHCWNRSRCSITFLFLLLVGITTPDTTTTFAAAATTTTSECTATSTTIMKPTVAELVQKPNDEIIDLLGGIYEHSKWVAEQFVADEKARKDITTVTELAKVLKQIVEDSTSEQKLALLKAHPDLGAKVETLKTLTKESQEEQGSAGLQTMTAEELEQFHSRNDRYAAKFQFPFILAVRNASKHTVLSALEGRLEHSKEVELAAALVQVHKIAWMRLLALVDTSDCAGYLTVHVLDTANGIPADHMRITLTRHLDEKNSVVIGEYVTNHDGRLDGGPALKGKDFQVGVYEWTFYTGDYFARKGTYTTGTPFLDVIPLRFGIDNPDDHYHVPLLVSPWSFSTYRGS